MQTFRTSSYSGKDENSFTDELYRQKFATIFATNRLLNCTFCLDDKRWNIKFEVIFSPPILGILH